VEARQSVKVIVEEVLHEEMIKHLEAGYRELTPGRVKASVMVTTPRTYSPSRA
jgi:hypothetical protein